MFSSAAALQPAAASSGNPLLADPVVQWLHTIADVSIGLACLSVSTVLVMLLRREPALRWIITVSAIFLLACGVAHLVQAVALFRPAPWIAGTSKVATAILASAAAVLLWPALAKWLSLRPRAELEREAEESRAAERRALEAEARIANVVANLSEAVFVLRVEDGQFLVDSVNPAFEKLFGVHAAEVQNGIAEEVLPRAMTMHCLPHWRDALAGGGTQDYEVTAEVPTGRRTWQTVLVPLRGPGGRVERLLGSARDVTATRRLQAGLVQSARLATLGTMCTGLAHEASQPLNIAGLWLRRARHAAQTSSADVQGAVSRALAVVEDQLRRAGELVARIRGLAGEDAAAQQRFDAVPSVAAAVRLACAQAAEQGVRITLHHPAAPMPVRGNPARLEEAVLHLLANACDSVQERRQKDPAAPARVIVNLRREAGRVVVEVRDSGTGIVDSLSETIFEPFFTTKEPGRGTGLGLTIAASIARGMGGGMEAWNLAAGGACFRMLLAADDEAPVAMAAA